MRHTIPCGIPNKANTYEIHFNRTFWGTIQQYVTGLKKYIRGPLYWIGPSSEVKQFEQVVGFYTLRILEEDTTGPVSVTIWMRGKGDVDGVKAVLDGIEKSGRIKNDRQVAELHVFRVQGPNESFDLEIQPMT
jgi:hypothetical protein